MTSLASALMIAASAAQAGPPEDMVTLDILPGWRTPDGTHMAGLRFTLAPGWKTYWRAPGDGGIPPLFSWTGSENVAGAEFHWPAPEVFHINGMMSIGYSGQVVIPVEITPDGSGVLRVAGQVDMGVCEDVCVPVTLDFEAVLPPDGGRDAAIAAALVDRPLTAEEAGVTEARCTVEPGAEGLTVTAALRMPPDGGEEVVVVEPGIPGVWVSEAVTHWQDDWLMAEVAMIAADGGPIALDREGLRFTVLGASGAVDIRGCAAG